MRSKHAPEKPRCGKWMPRAKTYCVATLGHKTKCMSPKSMATLQRCHERERNDPEYKAKRRARDRSSDTIRRKWKRDKLNELKLERGCADCEYKEHYAALDFDHLPQFEKTANLSRMVDRDVTWNEIMAEVAKCEVVCANCHRIRTTERRTGSGRISV